MSRSIKKLGNQMFEAGILSTKQNEGLSITVKRPETSTDAPTRHERKQGGQKDGGTEK